MKHFATAQLTAGPEMLGTMVWLPIILAVAFAGLYFYTRNMKRGAIGH